MSRSPCPDCGSNRSLQTNADGSRYCHSFDCKSNSTSFKGGGDGQRKPKSDKKKAPVELIEIETERGIKSRSISADTCAKYRYGFANRNGEKWHVIEIRDKDNHLCGYKYRSRDKDFSITGKLPKLIGMNLFSGGKSLVITEGELDMLSVSQVFGNKYPVVSLTNGASSATKALNENREYLKNFQSIVLMFDGDEAGRSAAEAGAKTISDMDVKIASLPKYKDANEALMAGDTRCIIDAFWNAVPYSPAELSTLADDVEELLKPIQVGAPWWFHELNEITYGRREGELYTFGAGTGVGKTDFLTQQIAYDVDVLKKPVAVFYLEMNKPEFAKRLASKIDACLYHIPNSGTSEDDLKKTLTRTEMENVHYYSAFGVNDYKEIKNFMVFLANKGVKHFYIDHLTALATGGDKAEKDELEEIMSSLAGVSQKYGLITHLISHLTTPEKGSHEEGARVTIRQFKGSRSIGFWSFFMFGLERNQQALNEKERQTTTFRVLKNRLTGKVGDRIDLGYDAESGLLYSEGLNIQSPFHGEGTESGEDDY